MTIFQSTEQIQTVISELFEGLLTDPILGPKFAEKNIIIKYIYTDPDGIVWLTPGDDKKGKVIVGESDLKADVEMTLSGDTCHKFWLKQVSMTVALAKRLIKTKGPLPKVLKLLPLLKPAFEAYPELAQSHGLSIDKK